MARRWENCLMVDGTESDCEDSYRVREMNKQMSPLQPLLDWTIPAPSTLIACMTQFNPVAKISVDESPNGQGRFCDWGGRSEIDGKGEEGLKVANSNRKEEQRSRVRVGERARENAPFE